MRRLPAFFLLASLAALPPGCSGSKGEPAPPARPADAGVADAPAAPDAAVTATGDAGTDGLGQYLSWYCPVGTAMCPFSEVVSYNRCLLDHCEAELKKCPCESWINCTTRCSCTDIACRAACVPPFECLNCGQMVARCVSGSGCERPACYTPPPPDAASPVPAPTPVPGIPVPGLPIPVPPRPDAAADTTTAPATPDAAPDAAPDGGLVGTCADLRRCCDSLNRAAARQTCLMQLMQLPTDQLCAAALLVYRGNGQCR
jgi:hypothetical protein